MGIGGACAVIVVIGNGHDNTAITITPRAPPIFNIYIYIYKDDLALTCLPMMWKILTVQIREGIYDSLISHKLFLNE